MRSVLPPSSTLPDLHRSVIACMASILELDVCDVPSPPPEHPEPWTVWRNWLAQRGLGLVPVSDPATFAWPGPWLALLRCAEDERGCVAAVAFGVPPGLAWSPLSGSESFEAVHAGYVIAPTDPTRWAPVKTTTVRTRGVVEVVAVAEGAEMPMVLVGQAVARAGRGLQGDRYFDGRGTFSNPHARGVDITLIEAEVLDELTLLAGRLAPQDARRNVVTRGIDLNDLVGKPFRIGEVECLGQRLCEPCAHLQRLTLPGTLRELVHRGGLRADVLTDGTIRLGDEITPS